MNLSIFCPPMKVNRVDSRTRLTDAEPMVATIDTGGVHYGKLVIEPVTILPTYVRRQRPLRWLVDACEGIGETDGWKLVVGLPEEPVVFSLSGFCMVAKAIDAMVILVGPDGTQYMGSVRFPDARCSLWTMTVEEVTAIGQVE